MSNCERNVGVLRVLVVTGALVAMLGGCAPIVLPPSQHAPTSAGLVGLYREPPAKYEALGIITVPVTPEMKWDERGDSTAGLDAIKAKAAAMGANGVLLVGKPGTFDLLATTGYHGEQYQVPIRREPKAAVVQAIFVVSE